MEPRIELQDNLKTRWAAFGVDDDEIQRAFRSARSMDPSLTEADFIERSTSDLQKLEKGREDARAEEAKQRQIGEAHQHQSNRIALAGMALPAVIAAADVNANITDIARLALDMADKVLDIADKSKDPILNA